MLPSKQVSQPLGASLTGKLSYKLTVTCDELGNKSTAISAIGQDPLTHQVCFPSGFFILMSSVILNIGKIKEEPFEIDW